MAARKLTPEEIQRQALAFHKARQPKAVRTRNFVIFGGLLASVMGIYTYSMYMTRQERIDFDEK